MAIESVSARKIFGFNLDGNNSDQKELRKRKRLQTFVAAENDDGALMIERQPNGAPEASSIVSQYGLNITLDSQFRDDVQLITKYREMSMQPEIYDAIEDIVNESIISKDNGESVTINLDEIDKLSDKQKKQIREEFKNILRLLNFNNEGHNLFKRWYIDGRLFYHVIVDDSKKQDGIQELRYIDPRKIKKVRQVDKEPQSSQSSASQVKMEKEFYLYSEQGIINSIAGSTVAAIPKNTIIIHKDSIVYSTSGLMDPKKRQVLSYVHKAIKPLNNLRLMEDATVIYRISRAPERRVFYIDVGNIPAIKQEQHLKDMMNRFRNRVTYDANTGALKDERNTLAMIEDFWMPRTSAGRTSEIITLPAGQNLGQIEDVEYFQKKLYKALDIPFSRTQSESGFSLGRAPEITRDEIKFSKFVDKLRRRFTSIFDDLLRTQLVLKGILTQEDWDEVEESIWYDFIKDNNYEEMKESDLLMNRLGILQIIDPYVGKYFSKEYVMKKVMRLNDDEIEEMDKKMREEIDQGIILDPVAMEKMQQDQMGMQMDQQAQQMDQQDQEQDMQMGQQQDAHDMDMQHKQEKHDADMKNKVISMQDRRSRDFSKKK